MPHITLMRKWILFIVLFLALTTMWILPQSQLFGPWRVQLVDAETQQPLDQAVVLIVFRKYYASVGGLAGGGYYNSAEGSTGVDGKVFIPSKRVFTVIPLLRTIQGPEVYIFKAGYGGWRFRGEEKWGESWQNGRMVVDMRKWIIPLSERSKFLDEMADRFERDGVVIELQPLKVEEERRHYQSFGAMPCCDIPPDKMHRYLESINKERALLGCKPLPRKSIFLEPGEKPC